MTLLAERYEPIGPSLKGGQGDVIVCRDIWLERDVVVKKLHTGGDPESLKKEIQIRKKVSSKYLAEIYDYFIDPDGEPRLALEYITGDELTSGNVVPVTDEEELIRFLFQLASGIADFHKAGIVHRDIKPHNCRLDSEGNLRIFDLGISSDLDESDVTKLGAGTHGFLAPELFKDGSKPVSGAIDTYAWGATAWFLSTGTLPSPLKSIPPQNKKSVSSFSSQFDNEVLVNLVDCSLSINPDDRPDMLEIAESLRREITHWRHKGLLIGSNGKRYLVDKDHQTLSVGVKSTRRRITIHYDGYKFLIKNRAGEVFINNHVAVPGEEFPSACVVTFGPPEEGPSRLFLNFSCAPPEIVV